ncbi:MAG: GlsB/YeaQ/YmgE family stress response membrane protein [Propionibacteriaceae bacterium]|nr:GlsB/YeaQ/YmgE family stress response membrane protein [Propionibacteriaceae bacterium]
MGIILWIIVGLLAGAIAKFIMPGKQGGGIIMTIILGIIGALAGGLLMNLLTGRGFTFAIDGGFWFTLLVAVIGALVVLFIYGLITKRSGRAA